MAVVDIDGAAARATASALGERANGFECDVSNPSSVEACVNAVVDQFGSIDVLHNNAATKTQDVRAFFTPFEDYRLETWREVMAVNIDGMFLMAQAVGRHMVALGNKGSIVQTASIYGMVGADSRIYEGSDYLGGPINTPASYAASKAAVIGLTRWLATYWAPRGIRVNCLVPGGVDSGQNRAVFGTVFSARAARPHGATRRNGASADLPGL